MSTFSKKFSRREAVALVREYNSLVRRDRRIAVDDPITAAANIMSANDNADAEIEERGYCEIKIGRLDSADGSLISLRIEK